MQGVILGGAWAQGTMVLLSSCQPTFCAAVHHLLEGVVVSTLGSGRGARHTRPMWYPRPLTAFLPQTARAVAQWYYDMRKHLVLWGHVRRHLTQACKTMGRTESFAGGGESSPRLLGRGQAPTKPIF